MDEEFLLFFEENNFRNFDFFYDVYDCFDLENMEEVECKLEFRVERCDIFFLVEVFGMLDIFICF